MLIDHLRHKYAVPTESDMDLIETPVDDAVNDLDADLVLMEQELALLPTAEREALTLFYLRELSLADVAEVLAVPLGTVKSRLFRARKMLRERLKVEG